MRILIIPLLLICSPLLAQPTTAPATRPATAPVKTQAELEADFAKMLSNATLEGSFNSTAAGRDMTRLSSDKYTLGTVRKLAGKVWLIQARIQYAGKDVAVPLPLPVEWAGDTPVIVVDNFAIPRMGTFNARVMFFQDHYAGYWAHGERGGHLFGIIHRAGATTQPTTAPTQP